MAKKGQPIYTEILNFYLYAIYVQPKKKRIWINVIEIKKP